MKDSPLCKTVAPLLAASLALTPGSALAAGKQAARPSTPTPIRGLRIPMPPSLSAPAGSLAAPLAAPATLPGAVNLPGALPSSLVSPRAQAPEKPGAVRTPAAPILGGTAGKALEQTRSDAERINRHLETGDVPAGSALAGRPFDASTAKPRAETVFFSAGSEPGGQPLKSAGGPEKPNRPEPQDKTSLPAQPAEEDSYRPGPEEQAFRARMTALLRPYVSRQGNGMANLLGYLGAGDYGTLVLFLGSDFYGKGFIHGRAPWTRLFYRSYARSFFKNPEGRWTRFLGRLASAEATDYLTAISELRRRPANPVMRKALAWRDSIDERAAALAKDTPPEDLERLARQAEETFLARSGDSTALAASSLDDLDKAVLVELYRFYQWMNARVEKEIFTDYYAQVIKGNTYRYTFDNGLLPFAKWGIFDHDPLPAL